MARNRMIKPKFFDDIKMAKCSRDARMLYVGMWVFADDMGVLPSDSLFIKTKVFPFDQIQLQQFEKWLDELSQRGFIRHFSHNGEDFIYLLNFLKHQRIDKPNLTDLFVKKTAIEAIISTFDDASKINPRPIADLIEEKRREENGKGLAIASPPDLAFRKLEFEQKVLQTFETDYPKQLLEKFISYWTEASENGKKMRFEKEKVFDVSRRLSTWAANEFKFNSSKNLTQISHSAQSGN